MITTKKKPQIPDVLERFKTYHEQNPVWGSLHIVLSDQNVEDSHVHFCLGLAIGSDDTEGAELANILLQMSRTQRLKLSNIA